MVKISLLFFVLLFSANVFAANNDCVDFVPCGTYEGYGRNYNQDNEVVERSDFFERWVVTSTGPLSINVKQSMGFATNPNKVLFALDLDIFFQEDGSYIAKRKNGKLLATGVCRTGRMCTLSFSPFLWEDDVAKKSGITGRVNIIRFEDTGITREMMSTSEKGVLNFQRSQLMKK